MEGKEADIIGEDMCDIGREAKVEFIRDDLFGGFKSIVDDFIAPGGFLIYSHMIVVDGQIGVIRDFNISDFVVVDVLLVDLLADDVQSDIIFLLYHDFHLVENELKFLSLVHRPVRLDLHFLQDVGCLHDIVLVLLALHDHQHTSCVLHLRYLYFVLIGKSSLRKRL